MCIINSTCFSNHISENITEHILPAVQKPVCWIIHYSIMCNCKILAIIISVLSAQTPTVISWINYGAYINEEASIHTKTKEDLCELHKGVIFRIPYIKYSNVKVITNNMLPLCKKQRKIIYPHAYFCKKKYKTRKTSKFRKGCKGLQARRGYGWSDLSQITSF